MTTLLAGPPARPKFGGDLIPAHGSLSLRIILRCHEWFTPTNLQRPARKCGGASFRTPPPHGLLTARRVLRTSPRKWARVSTVLAKSGPVPTSDDDYHKYPLLHRGAVPATVSVYKGGATLSLKNAPGAGLSGLT